MDNAKKGTRMNIKEMEQRTCLSRALQAGQLALPEAMEQRLQALEQETVRNGQDQQVCRAMAQEQAEYASFDAERYWAQLTCPAEGAGEIRPGTGPVPGTDRPEPFPWRRFAARWLDLILCNTLVQLPLLWRLWKSYGACCEELLLPWEEEVQCRCRKLPGWRYLLAPVALGLMIFALVLGVKGQLVPRQQGPLTVA